MAENKVINFKPKLTNHSTSASLTSPVDMPLVVDMTERRQAIINQERRQVKRTLLSEFIGAWVVVPGQGLQKCAIYDISEKGVALDIDTRFGHFAPNEEIAVRIYMNANTFFPFTVTIENTRKIVDEDVFRHGCSFVEAAVNHEALYHFVRFIETVSASLHTDTGDRVVSQLSQGS